MVSYQMMLVVVVVISAGLLAGQQGTLVQAATVEVRPQFAEAALGQHTVSGFTLRTVGGTFIAHTTYRIHFMAATSSAEAVVPDWESSVTLLAGATSVALPDVPMLTTRGNAYNETLLLMVTSTTTDYAAPSAAAQINVQGTADAACGTDVVPVNGIGSRLCAAGVAPTRGSCVVTCPTLYGIPCCETSAGFVRHNFTQCHNVTFCEAYRDMPSVRSSSFTLQLVLAGVDVDTSTWLAYYRFAVNHAVVGTLNQYLPRGYTAKLDLSSIVTDGTHLTASQPNPPTACENTMSSAMLPTCNAILLRVRMPGATVAQLNAMRDLNFAAVTATLQTHLRSITRDGVVVNAGGTAQVVASPDDGLDLSSILAFSLIGIVSLSCFCIYYRCKSIKRVTPSGVSKSVQTDALTSVTPGNLSNWQYDDSTDLEATPNNAWTKMKLPEAATATDTRPSPRVSTGMEVRSFQSSDTSVDTPGHDKGAMDSADADHKQDQRRHHRVPRLNVSGISAGGEADERMRSMLTGQAPPSSTRHRLPPLGKRSPTHSFVGAPGQPGAAALAASPSPDAVSAGSAQSVSAQVPIAAGPGAGVGAGVSAGVHLHAGTDTAATAAAAGRRVSQEDFDADRSSSPAATEAAAIMAKLIGPRSSSTNE